MPVVARGGTSGLRSMTGFGVAEAGGPGGSFRVELRSVNHRHLKLGVRLPEVLSALAPRVEERLRARLRRGSVQLTVRPLGEVPGAGVRLDADLLRRLHGELSAVAAELGVEPPGLGEVARLEGVVRTEEVVPELDALWPLLESALGAALDELDAMRRREGEGIAADLLEVASLMEREVDAVEERLPAARAEQAARLRERVAGLLEQAPDSLRDAPELAREVALLADRADVSEEVQRLRSHLDQLREVLEADAGPAGRKIEFLAQELLREANTLGSKSQDLVLRERSLALKLLVERVREQAANLE
ncbi:MAG: YicC family protein [Planctomycetota bacterium]|nr:MAG: YicC family protein [Planctomycetota bacterium]